MTRIMKFTYFAASSAALFVAASAAAVPIDPTGTGATPTRPDGAIARLPPGGSATTTGDPSAMTHKVHVGNSGNIYYDPQVVMASPGDTIIFEFRGGNHTLTESTFEAPCKKLDGGVDTEFSVANLGGSDPGPKFTHVVKDTKPQWFHCRQIGHCAKGMIFAINPTAGQTFEDFRFKAIEQGTPALSSVVTSPSTTSTGTSSSTSSSTPPSTSSGTSPGITIDITTTPGSSRTSTTSTTDTDSSITSTSGSKPAHKETTGVTTTDTPGSSRTSTTSTTDTDSSITSTSGFKPEHKGTTGITTTDTNTPAPAAGIPAATTSTNPLHNNDISSTTMLSTTIDKSATSKPLDGDATTPFGFPGSVTKGPTTLSTSIRPAATGLTTDS